jgi:hypothetical protein
MQVGLDIVTSAICKSQLQFQQTNNYQHLYVTSSKYFQSAAVTSRRNSNTQTAQSPSRRRLLYFDTLQTEVNF